MHVLPQAMICGHYHLLLLHSLIALMNVGSRADVCHAPRLKKVVVSVRHERVNYRVSIFCLAQTQHGAAVRTIRNAVALKPCISTALRALLFH